MKGSGFCQGGGGSRAPARDDCGHACSHRATERALHLIARHQVARGGVFPFASPSAPVRSCSVTTIRVEAGQQSYDVLVGAGLIEKLGELCAQTFKVSGCAVVTDENVATLYGNRVLASLTGAGFRPALFTIA